jgi:hypothetical protein
MSKLSPPEPWPGPPPSNPPAFPRAASEFTRNGTLKDGNDAISEQDGMSLRDYFAAHAPRKPQAWFEPSMPPCPEPIYDHDHGIETVGCYGYDGCQLCAPTNARERMAWRDEFSKQVFVQWPYAWADAMLKAREK